MRRWLSISAVVALVVGLFVLVPGAPAQAAAPGNDAFADAIDLGSSPNGSTTGSNLDATSETDERGGLATIWWTWTAPADGTYLFDACGSDFPAQVLVFEGDSVGSLTDAPVTSQQICWYGGDWWEIYSYEFTATAGSTYHVQVSDSSYNEGAQGDVVLNWWQSAVPGNDAFADAQTIVGANGSQPGTVRFATHDDGQSASLYDSVWYRWVAPATGDYVFDTCGTTMDTKFIIYTGDSLASLVPQASGDDNCSYQSLALLSAEASVAYTIAVSTYSDEYTGGDFDLRWQAEAAPANDAFADAVAITGANGTATGNNRFATVELDDPNLYDSVWWSWTAPADGTVVFDTCGSNSEMWMDVYAGTELASLTLVPATYGYCLGAFADGVILMFDAVAGTTYTIAVSDMSSDQLGGDIGLRWRMGEPPANDDIANAIALSGDGGTALASNLFATEEGVESTAGIGVHTIWWTWTAASSAPVSFDTAGSKLSSSAIVIFAGTEVGSLSLAAYATTNWGGGQAQVTFTPVQGQAYLIGVGSDDDDMGDVVLHWPASEGYALVAPYVITDPADQTVVAGSGTSFSASAGGNPAPTVQWELSTDGGTSYNPIAGETNTTLTLSTSDATMNGYRYRAAFTNSEDTAWTTAATLTVLFAPAVTTSPLDQTVAALTTATFTAAASGNLAPTVQWERSTDGGSSFTPISGATSSSYSFTAAQSMTGYQYRAVFTNSQGSATSTAATLTVTPSQASVTSVAATASKGKITVTFTGVGDPFPTGYQCRMNVRNAVWVSCVSGDVFKSSAKTVSVRASNDGGSTWGPITTVSKSR